MTMISMDYLLLGELQDHYSGERRLPHAPPRRERLAYSRLTSIARTDVHAKPILRAEKAVGS